MRKESYSRYIAIGVTAFCVITASIFLFFALAHFDLIQTLLNEIIHILRPILYGLVLAFLLLPVHRFIDELLCTMASRQLDETKSLRGLLNFTAIILSLSVAGLLIYILLAMVIPQIYYSIVGLVQAMPGHLGKLQEGIQDFFHAYPEIEIAILPYYDSISESVLEWLHLDQLVNLESVSGTLNWLRTTILPGLSNMASNVSALLISFLGLAKDILIAVIVSVYLLLRKDTLSAQSKKIVYSMFPTRIGDFIVQETRSAYRILSGFINGKLLDSLIIGIICLVCCNLFKFPYPALIATIVGVTNIIPFFGPFIGAVPCAILILLVSPIQCIYFVIFILVLQQFDGNILGPKILGDSTGLDAFWVLFSILLFGGLFGFAGMVLGVPVFAMFYSMVSRLVRYGLKKRGLPEDTSFYLGKTDSLHQK